jgi:hypothetical protein
MRDVAHRYEAQRIRKLSGPVSRGPPLVMQKGTLTRKHTRRRTHSAPSAIVCVSVYHEVGRVVVPPPPPPPVEVIGVPCEDVRFSFFGP